jgi:AraC-like DNA-binding protein
MRQAASLESFTSAPSGQWTAVACGVIWCHSPTLVGAVVWGRPGARETQQILEVFEHYECMAPRFDVLLDASRIGEIDAGAFDVLLEWSRTHREMLLERVRRRVSVVPSGLGGFALAGISVAVGGLDAVQLTSTARAGFEILCPGEAEAIDGEIETIAAGLGGTPGFLLELRAQFHAHTRGLTLEQMARSLSLSTRSLQRRLAEAGTSFRSELHDARFRAAREILSSSDEKLDAIAQRLGITESALAELIRARTQLTVAEFRRQLRAG